LYKRVKSGEECVRVLKSTGADNYKEVLDAELNELGNSEMWRAGAAVRKLRPVK
jgi:ketol-acid reductoisomerase